MNEKLASYDLTPKMAPYFDVHMVSNLLNHLSEMSIYQQKSVTKEKIKLVEPTNMIDLVVEEYLKFPDDKNFQKEYEDRKATFEEKKEKIFYQIDNEPENVQTVTAFFEDITTVTELKNSSSLTVEHLKSNHNIDSEMLEEYYKFSKFKYECGMYSDAEDMLANIINISQISPAMKLGALWGRLACRILQEKWSQSLEDLNTLKEEAIDIRNIAAIDQLRQRAWVMHWGLFVYLLEGGDSVAGLVDLYSDSNYLQTLENLCPWLLRYYSAAVILSPAKRHTKLKDLLAEITFVQYQYSDPITEFLGSLFDEFDFDEAQLKLKQCQELVKNDFFLQSHADSFMREARMLICEMYCAINSKVDLTMLADKLHLTDEEAERWMVDMVRGTNTSNGTPLEAKIDSSGKQVIISPPTRTVNKNIVEATRDLTTRSGILGSNLETLAKKQAVYIRQR